MSTVAVVVAVVLLVVLLVLTAPIAVALGLATLTAMWIGDVPISPYTTPMVTSSMAGVTTRFFNVFSLIRYTLSAS